MAEVVLANARHLPLVAQLERETFREPWSEQALGLFLTEHNFCAVCLDGDNILSYCTVTTVLDEAQIINVATSDVRKGCGFATKTLQFVIEECKKREIASISLEVRASNEPAISLYNKLGFHKEGIRRAFYRDPREDALVMVKIID